MSKIYSNLINYDEDQKIRKNATEYTWDDIVELGILKAEELIKQGFRKKKKHKKKKKESQNGDN